MARLEHVQSIWASDLPVLGQLTRILPGMTAGAGTAANARALATQDAGAFVLHDPVSRTMMGASFGQDLLGVADFRRSSAGTAMRGLTVDGGRQQVNAATLDWLAAHPGETAQLHFNGLPQAGQLAALHSFVADGATWLAVARVAGQGITLHALQPGTADLVLAASVNDRADTYLRGVVAIDSLTIGSRVFLVAASTTENGVSVLQVGTGGRLTPVAALGAAQELPVSVPTDIVTVAHGGSAWAIMAAAGTGSLTVLSVSATGQLAFVDQVNDSRDTRFGGVTSVDALVWGGQILVAAAGNDGGVSLFQLLPDGRLLLRATFVDGLESAADGITDLRLMLVDGRPEILVVGARDGGLARLRYDPGPEGAVGRTTPGADLLVAGPAGGSLSGGAGDDILVDGPGADVMTGGPGADIFVFGSDGVEDRILDFNPAEDRIEMGFVPGLYSVAGLSVAPTGSGAVIRWGGERLVIVTHDRQPLAAEILRGLIDVQSGRVSMPDSSVWLTHRGGDGADVLTGTNLAETFLGGAGADWILPGDGSDTIDGGRGTDMLSYGDLGAGVVVNLTTGIATKATGQDRITGIENVTGTTHADYLTGDAGANLLRGLGGYDWFIATAGADTYDGGTGRDMVTYAGATGPVTVDLGRGIGTRGLADGHSYISVERATGSIHADLFYGSAGDDDFRGLGGYDWFIGSAGRDSYDGGTGIDMVSYAMAPGGVSASLLLGRGWRGQAARDSYTGVENLTGSSHADVLIGDHGRNLLRGGAGDDTLMGMGGNDRLVGGPGNDVLEGGPGYDYAEFSGPRSAYRITRAGDVTWVLGPDGHDRLTGIEVLVFDSGNFYL